MQIWQTAGLHIHLLHEAHIFVVYAHHFRILINFFLKRGQVTIDLLVHAYFD
jgi:hypothetical protein